MALQTPRGCLVEASTPPTRALGASAGGLQDAEPSVKEQSAFEWDTNEAKLRDQTAANVLSCFHSLISLHKSCCSNSLLMRERLPDDFLFWM